MLLSFLLFMILLFVIQLQAMAQSNNSETSPANPRVPVVLPTQLTTKPVDSSLQEAYLDTFKVLSMPNRCSEFYGGPAVAITVLNELFAKIKREKLPDYVTFSMRGRYTNVFNIPSQASFRVFEKTLLNSAGSFYQRNSAPDHRFPNIGPFSPGSRPARALSLLHELGHLIRSPNGDWLIPDDGNDVDKSRSNTETIGNICNSELRRLK